MLDGMLDDDDDDSGAASAAGIDETGSKGQTGKQEIDRTAAGTGTSSSSSRAW